MIEHEVRPLEPNYGRRMSHAEAVMLCRYAKAACPQQAFDAYTPDAWSDLLGDLRFVDCQEAVKAVVSRQPFVSPAEIRTEVKRVRNKRIGDFGVIPCPDGLSEMDYSRYMGETLRAIADGELRAGEFPANYREVVAVDRPLGEIRAGQSITDAMRADPAEARAAARKAAEEGRAQFQASVKPPSKPLLGPGDITREPEESA